MELLPPVLSSFATEIQRDGSEAIFAVTRCNRVIVHLGKTPFS